MEASKNIANEYTNNKSNVLSYIDIIDRVEGISCTIADNNLEIKFNSFPQKAGVESQKLPNEIETLIKSNEASLSKGFIYSIVEKPQEQAAILVYISKIDNSNLIVLKKSMKGIIDSVAIANQFYIFAGLILIFLGAIFIFIFASRITKPIREMSAIAEDISNLDFEKRVQYSSEDEIGNLGNSINNISEKLSSSMDGLKQDVERRKELVRNISHELKTPIGVIKGYAEGLQFSVADDEEKREKYCKVISNECDRMDSLVRELLNLSMFESGTFQIKTSEFDIRVLVQNIAERFEPTFAEKGIDFEWEMDKELFVSADYELIERVIINFIINAINHVEGNKKISINIHSMGEKVRIEVFNTGKHIQEEELVRIWDIFYKVDKARSREYGGNGLGLSISRLIGEAHGGKTGVENVNEGVMFFIEIPNAFKLNK